MNSAKKSRLEGAGWKVGTAAEFLSLNKEEAAFVEMKLALARCLHALRIRRKLSQSRVAALVGSRQSRVAKMESGDPSVSVDLLLRSVLAIGGSPTEIVRALAARKKLTPASPHRGSLPPRPRHPGKRSANPSAVTIPVPTPSVRRATVDKVRKDNAGRRVVGHEWR